MADFLKRAEPPGHLPHATIANLLKMMDFLEMDSFVIPSHNIPFPLEGKLYRPNQVFRLLNSGTMTYKGSGGVPMSLYPDVVETNIPMSQIWIDRAYVYMIDGVRKLVRKKAERAVMQRVEMLILKFNKLDFIKMDNT